MAVAPTDDEPFVDPDTLKVPETATHRQTVELIAQSAVASLGGDVWVFRDLNWYPSDGGNAIAPDVMVLDRSVLDSPPRSYRQDKLDGPPPLVVVEVASASDVFANLIAKANRCRRLGTSCYVLTTHEEPTLLRLTAASGDLAQWTDRPIPELGGLTIGFDGADTVLTLPTGERISAEADLVAVANERAERAKRQAELAQRQAELAQSRAAQAEERAEALEAQLAALGVDPV